MLKKHQEETQDVNKESFMSSQLFKMSTSGVARECVCACLGACARAHVCVCMHACMHVSVPLSVRGKDIILQIPLQP